MPPPDPREAALARVIVKLLEEEHLLHKRIDDSVSRTAFTAFMERLDATKMFLLKSDREHLAVYTDKIDDQLRSGSLDLAHEGARRYQARVAVVEKMVADILAKPFDFTNDEQVEIDAEKMELAADDNELRERWRKRLELDVLERVLGMEARLEADAERKQKNAGKAPTSGNAARKSPSSPPGAGSATAPDAEDDERSLPIAQIPPTPEGREAKAREDLAKTYSGRFARLKTAGPLDAAADLVNAVSGVLDPHTMYLPPSDKANFDIQMSGSLEGIGAVLREKDHYIEIVEIVPGGASYRHGRLAPGDIILSVAQQGKDPVDTFDMRIDEVVKMIRGPKGTSVKLRIQKPTGTEETLTITRDVVVIEETYAKGAVIQTKGAPALGYIHLPSFYGGRGSPRSAAEDVRRLLTEMRGRKVAGVIVDLRSNGGGLLGDAVEMTGQLIDRGPVVMVQDNEGEKEVLSDDRPGFDFDKPVVVMVDRFSASASEIVAGALQDYQRAVVVGTGPTHGKGTVQTLADLDRATGGQVELGVFKLTIQQFFRVSGASTQREGVRPDILLPDPAGHIESGERELEHAIAWSSIAPAPYTKWPATWDLPTLSRKSATRVAKHPILAKVATSTAVLKARRADTKLPLSRAAYEARRKEQKAALEAASPDLTKLQPAFTVTTLENPAAKKVEPRPDGKPDDRATRWKDNLARDPWIEEAAHILADMTK